MKGVFKVLRGLIRFLLGLLVGLALTLLLIAGAIYLSRGAIKDWVLATLSEAFSARITLGAMEVGRIWDLPALSVRLQGFTLQSQTGDTLFVAERVQLDLDLWEALVHKNYRIQGLHLEAPVLYWGYDRRGRSLWQAVLRSDTGEKASSPWSIARLRISEGRFVYFDVPARFELRLQVAKLVASLKYFSQYWAIEGEGAGKVERLREGRRTWLEGQPFGIQGGLRYEREWLLLSGLWLRLAGLSARLEGGIDLSRSLPSLSLRVQDMDLDLQALKRFWSDLPPELGQLNGALQAQGEITGPVGRGKLPRIQVQAYLQVNRPFLLRAYPVHRLWAQGQLRWDPAFPKQSFLELSQVSWLGGESDSVKGRFRYHLGRDRITGQFQGQLNLAFLSALGLLRPEDSVAGSLAAHLEFRREGTHWLLTGEGSLTQASLGGAAIPHLAFSLTPAQLTLRNATLHYEDLQIEAPFFTVEHYQRWWDSTSAPMRVRGRLRLPAWRYTAAPAQSERTTLPPIYSGEVEIVVDTAEWEGRRLGALRGAVFWEGESLGVHLHALEGIGGGRLEGQIFGRGTPQQGGWQVHGEFQSLRLQQVAAEWPELDTLFPLLKHLHGEATGSLQAYLPLRAGRLAWADLEGELVLRLRNFVVLESPYTYNLFSLIPLTDFRRIEVGALEARLHVAEGVVRLDTTWLQANRWRMRVAGSHTLRGELRYDLLVEVPRVLLDKSMSRVEEWVEEVEGERMRLAVLVSGTTEAPSFRWKPAGSTAKGADSPPKRVPAPRSKRRSQDLPVEEN